MGPTVKFAWKRVKKRNEDGDARRSVEVAAIEFRSGERVGTMPSAVIVMHVVRLGTYWRRVP